MIKTVSFAPPRSARAAAKVASKSSSKPANVQPAHAAESASGDVAVASRPAKMQPALLASGSSPIPESMTDVAPARRRAATKTPAAPDEASSMKVPTPEAVPAQKISAPEIVAPAIKAPTKRAARKSNGAAPEMEFSTGVEAQIEAETDATSVTPDAATAPVAPKIKRSRAPKDLAAQYGGAPETGVAPRVVAEKPAPRKRLTRAAKEARSQMLRPDDDVLQRLQQANSIEVKKSATRGRGWEFECGRCGRITRFQTPAAICQCGAIAVRE